MNFKDIGTLYLHELRSALRERAIVVNSILMPIFLYPVLLWVMFSAITFIEGANEGFISRIVIEGELPPAHAALRDTLAAHEGVEILEGMDEAAALAAIAEGDVDALVVFGPARDQAATLAENFTVDVRYDGAESRSNTAAERVEGIVADYREAWTERAATDLGMPDEARIQFWLTDENVTPDEDFGAFLLGQMVSLFLVIMVALGCFYPAIDTTAGERERNTWETLMTTAASRGDVVTAKYFLVATLGVVAGMLNVIALFVSIGAIIEPLIGQDASFSFTLHPLAPVVMILGAAVIALFFAAAMMILASFARTFKDGQAMILPVYYLIFIPLLLGDQSDQTLTPAIASIPVANVSMMIRDAMNGVFLWPLIAQTLAVNLVLVALCLWAARKILGFEDFLMGSFDGSFWRFAKDRLGWGGKKAKETA